MTSKYEPTDEEIAALGLPPIDRVGAAPAPSNVVTLPVAPLGNSSAPTPPQGAGKVDYSDHFMADRFVTEHGQDVRHVVKEGRWVQRSGSVWNTIVADEVRGLIADMCRRAADEAKGRATLAGDEEQRKYFNGRVTQLNKHSTTESIYKACCNWTALFSDIDEWDRHRHLLNTPDGVVDLNTGSIRAHLPTDMFFMQAAVSPKSIPTPRFDRFLLEIAKNDIDLFFYLLELGYAGARGLGVGKSLRFLYGEGANGKSAFLRLLALLLGSYSHALPSDLFTTSFKDKAEYYLAQVRGRRLITSTELDDGKSWSLAMLKKLTGGEEVVGRDPGGKPFSFVAQAIFCIGANSKPKLTDTGRAVQRRIDLVPFTADIPDAKQIDRLADILSTEEGPGILDMILVAGRNARQQGQRRPGSVVEATVGYLDDEDLVGQWIEEECDLVPSAQPTTARLFIGGWKIWATQRNISTRDHAWLGKQIAKRARKLGLGKAWDSNGRRGPTGIDLKKEVAEDNKYAVMTNDGHSGETAVYTRGYK